MADFDRVLVVDLGAQYAQLIARRVREASVYSEIVPHDISPDEVTSRRPAAIILSGGPKSVNEPNAPSVDPAIFELGIPILGICYGQQLLAKTLGGTVSKSGVAEYGKTSLQVSQPGILLRELPDEQTVWMSHWDAVLEPPDGFRVLAATDNSPCAAIEDPERRLYGVQFHPEVTHTPHGNEVLRRFLYDGAGCRPTWTAHNVIEELVGQVREQVGDRPVLCGLSGGVDSAVAAALVARAVGDQLTCVFVDHGLMRHDEGAQVTDTFRGHFDVDLVHVKAEDRFLEALAGVEDPEAKRKIIGEHFIRVFEQTARDIYADSPGHKFLVQGTLYPDVIESGSTTTSVDFPTTWTSSSSSRCGRCSRTRSASSAASSASPRKWSSASPSPARAWPSGLSVRSRANGWRWCGPPIGSSSRNCAPLVSSASSGSRLRPCSRSGPSACRATSAPTDTPSSCGPSPPRTR